MRYYETVGVTLPLSQRHAHPGSRRMHVPSSSTAKILLVDDSELIISATADLLRGEGFDVQSAGDSQQVDHLLGRWLPDIVVVDVQSQSVNAAQLCERLRVLSSIRIVAVAALTGPELATAARACGANAYLSKLRGGSQLPTQIRDLCRELAMMVEVTASHTIERRKILVLDDSDMVLRFIKDLFTKEGFAVASAASLVDFNRMLADWKPDLILADVNLPDVKGEELCRKVKSNPETTGLPFVLFSSLPESDLATLSQRCGADAFISKQGGFEAITEKINELCDQIIW
jgi:CheY-like chemotaxis protein